MWGSNFNVVVQKLDKISRKLAQGQYQENIPMFFLLPFKRQMGFVFLLNTKHFIVSFCVSCTLVSVVHAYHP